MSHLLAVACDFLIDRSLLSMLSETSIVLALVAIDEKISNLRKRKKEYENWMKSSTQTQANRDFWNAHIASADKDILAFQEVRKEILKTQIHDH